MASPVVGYEQPSDSGLAQMVQYMPEGTRKVPVFL